MLRHRARLVFSLPWVAPRASGGADAKMTNPLPPRQLEVCSYWNTSRLSAVNGSSKAGVCWCGSPYKSSIADTTFRNQHGLRGVITCP